VDYLNIQHSVATPALTWYAGEHSTNNQGVDGSGWIFTAAPALTAIGTFIGNTYANTKTIESYSVFVRRMNIRKKEYFAYNIIKK
jgi:hypothetical protein